eukprot:6316804-Amphidinium_carterae.1
MIYLNLVITNGCKMFKIRRKCIVRSLLIQQMRTCTDEKRTCQMSMLADDVWTTCSQWDPQST